MRDFPCLQEGFCLGSGEFRASIGCQFFSYAKCNEGSTQGSDEPATTTGSFFDNGPVTIAVHRDEIVVALVVEVICNNRLEGVNRLDRWGRWHAGL